VTAFLPDGSKIRSFADGEFRFVAEAPGMYRLDVKPTQAGKVRIAIHQIQPLADRLHLAMPDGERSPRIVALEKELRAGHREALAKFWDDVAREGTPLAEPAEKEPNYLLVTFVWRETFETNNVLVGWFPYAAKHPDDFQMTRLAGTDLWHKTIKIRKGARFAYQLSPNDSLSRSPNAQRNSTTQADPLNPKRRGPPNASKYETLSIAELPGAPRARWKNVPAARGVR
jgi:Domain of unknown function (DUF3327)